MQHHNVAAVWALTYCKLRHPLYCKASKENTMNTITQHNTKTIWCLLLLMAIASTTLFSCATTKIATLMPQISTVNVATAHFGPPTSQTQLPSGTTQYEWLIDTHRTISAHYKEVQRVIRHDRDGYPVTRTEGRFVQERTESVYCRVIITANTEGTVESYSWDGNSCDELLVR